MIVTPSEQSKLDVLRIAQYIARDSQTVALNFLDGVEETYDMLAVHPSMGHTPVFDFVEGLETIRIKGFKHYYVYYRVLDGRIRIDRVADGRRDLPALFKYLSDD